MAIAVAHIKKYLEDRPEAVPAGKSAAQVVAEAREMDESGDGILLTTAVQDLLGHTHASALGGLVETDSAYLAISIEALENGKAQERRLKSTRPLQHPNPVVPQRHHSPYIKRPRKTKTLTVTDR